MKTSKKLYIVLVALVLFFVADCGKKNEIVICGNRCPGAAPWRVESLDLGLPCFATKQQCTDWANTHGYGDRNCVLCN
jgi:hypothetical protein